MKVARNTTHGLRHDWFNATDERDAVWVSVASHRNSVVIQTRINGIHKEQWMSLRKFAEELAAMNSGG